MSHFLRQLEQIVNDFHWNYEVVQVQQVTVRVYDLLSEYYQSSKDSLFKRYVPFLTRPKQIQGVLEIMDKYKPFELHKLFEEQRDLALMYCQVSRYDFDNYYGMYNRFNELWEMLSNKIILSGWEQSLQRLSEVAGRVQTVAQYFTKIHSNSLVTFRKKKQELLN